MYPKFSLKYSSNQFGIDLTYLNDYKLHSNDDDPDETIGITLDNFDTFRYNAECLRFHIMNGSLELTVNVTVFDTGLIKFDMRECESLYGIYDSEIIRYIVRELYFSLKKHFHEDIHHVSDENGSKNMNHGDDNFTIVEADDMENGLELIFGTIIRKCESGLKKIGASQNEGGVESDNTVYLMTTGFISYGFNYLNVFSDELGDNQETFKESLESCKCSLNSLDHAFFNQTDREMKKHAEELNDQMLMINRRMLLLTLLSIGVALFAGSILADALSGISVQTKGCIMFVGSIIVIILSVLIHRYTKTPSDK